MKILAVKQPDNVEEIIYSFAVFMTDKKEDFPNGYAVQEWIDLNGGWVSVYKMQQSSFPVNIIVCHILHSIATQKRFVCETCNNTGIPMALTESESEILVTPHEFTRIQTVLILFLNSNKFLPVLLRNFQVQAQFRMFIYLQELALLTPQIVEVMGILEIWCCLVRRMRDETRSQDSSTEIMLWL